jgi:hypothetical protein
MNLQLFLFRYLYIAPHVLLIPVAIVMYRKGLHRQFPIFFSYLLYELLEFCVFYPIVTRLVILPMRLYLDLDQLSRAGDIVLHLGILQELFESPLKNSDSLRQTGAHTLKWVTVALVVMASAFIGFGYYTQSHRLPRSYAEIEALNIATCFLLVFVFLWHRFLGLKMSTFAFGIALGLGLTAGLEPLFQSWKDSMFMERTFIPDLLQMATYHCSVLVWLYFVFAREKVTSQSIAAPLAEIRRSAADMGRIVRL